MIKHNLDPVYNSESEILILGSFPSVKSRENRFYYAHPKNRFWLVLSSIFNESLPETIKDKKDFLYRHRIAVWDVIESCNIVGSSDISISDVKVNDVAKILNKSKVDRIFVNGKTALKYYQRYLEDHLKIQAIYLPSTSPANASYTLDKLIDSWKIIK